MESPVIDLSTMAVKSGKKPQEDVKDDPKQFLTMEYFIPVLIQSVTPVKAPEDTIGEAPKELFEVTMTAYLTSPMVANLFSKANGHFVEVRF